MCNALDEGSRAEIETKVVSASSLVVYVGFDGTLAPMVANPELARLPAQTQSVLEDLSTREGVLVALMCGQPLADLRARVGISSVVCGGDHGLEIEGASLRFEHPEMARRRLSLADLNHRLSALPLLFAGIHVEARTLSTSIHFRQADELSREHLRTIVGSLVPADHPDFVVTEGAESYEIRPRVDWNKGDAVRWIHERIKASQVLPVVIGDDPTDEQAFGALDGAISIRVGIHAGSAQPTSARYCVNGEARVGDVLHWILELWKRRPGAGEDSQEGPARRSGPGLVIKESSPILNVRVRRGSAMRKKLASEGGTAPG
jgi:trehalose-phosphatase